jgi:hypothetical protein
MSRQRALEMAFEEMRSEMNKLEDRVEESSRQAKRRDASFAANVAEARDEVRAMAAEAEKTPEQRRAEELADKQWGERQAVWRPRFDPDDEDEEIPYRR